MTKNTSLASIERVALPLALALVLAACGASGGTRRGSGKDGGGAGGTGGADGTSMDGSSGKEPPVDGPPPGDGGAPEAPAGDGGGGSEGASPKKWPGSCDPIAQDCPTGQQCDLDCSKGLMFQCLMEGTGKLGDKCSKSLCVRGLTCTGASVAEAVCRKLCNTDADCTEGRACDVDDGLICKMGGMSIGYLCGV